MASQLYPGARQLFATAALNWTNVALTVRALLLPDSWVANFDTDEFLEDIAANVRIAISEPIEDRTAVLGICSGTHAKWPLLVDNRLVSKCVVFIDTGDEATSRLLAYIDDFVQEPFLPLGFDYYLYPNATEGGFFRI